MEYSKLVAVSGLPGLFELINSKTDGAIVRSLEDNSTKFASSRIHNFSHLESIEIYTTGENVNLVEIFHAMEKAGGSLPDGKDNAALKSYFEKAYPELDFERVYPSDLKKMVKWFDILKKKNVEIKLTEYEEEAAPVVEEQEPAKKETTKKVKAESETEEAPKKKTAAKKAKEEGEAEEAPKKKTAAKKVKEETEGEETPKKKSAAKKK